MCPSRIAMYGELTVSLLAWLHSGQPALFVSVFYLYLGFTPGHWVSGTGSDLSVLFLHNIQHRHVWYLRLLVVLYVMPITNSADIPPGHLWLFVHMRTINTLLQSEFASIAPVLFQLWIAVTLAASLVQEEYRKLFHARENCQCWPGWWWRYRITETVKWFG